MKCLYLSRQSCSRAHRQLLSRLPSPFDVRCPKCMAYLKLMPKVNEVLLKHGITHIKKFAKI